MGSGSDASRILVARGLRAFGDGFVALLVPIYLLELGFSALAIGAIVTSTLIGTALLTLWAGMVANRYSVRRLLLAAAVLMAATGAAFAVTTAFWPLLLIAKEVAPVMKTLRDNSIEVTALHNHMLGDEPRLFFMHFWANDDAGKLAQGLKAALDKINVKHG